MAKTPTDMRPEDTTQRILIFYCVVVLRGIVPEGSLNGTFSPEQPPMQQRISSRKNG
jgi:hypothetical protein